MVAPKPVRPAPYAGLHVVEIAEDVGGEFVGRLLAEMGADVVKVETPRGSATRSLGPFALGRQDGEHSLAFWYYNSNKKSVVLDPDTPTGRAAFEQLLSSADVLVSTLQPAALKARGLDLRALAARFPRLIVLSVTAFGLDGPWADYKSSDLVALAAGGPLNSCGYDDHSIPPIRPGGDQAYHSAASFAHIGFLLALLDRQRTGRGQVVDISMHESCAVNIELANPYWFYPRVNVKRQTCRHAQPIPTQPALFRCADDRYVYYTLILSEQKSWQVLVAWMEEKGVAANLGDPEFLDVNYRQEHMHEIQSLVECFFLIQPAHEAYHEGQARGLPIGVLNAPEDLFEDDHLRARGFFVDVEQADGSRVKYPGSSYVFSSFGAIPRTRAPGLGEHTVEVLGAVAGQLERKNG